MTGTCISTACENLPQIVILVNPPIRMIEGSWSGVTFCPKCSDKEVYLELANHFTLEGHHVAIVYSTFPRLPV